MAILQMYSSTFDSYQPTKCAIAINNIRSRKGKFVHHYMVLQVSHVNNLPLRLNYGDEVTFVDAKLEKIRIRHVTFG